jgi:hypothetical protein
MTIANFVRRSESYAALETRKSKHGKARPARTCRDGRRAAIQATY